MADQEDENAKKLAAAKKRFEELKKKKGKKGGKATEKKASEETSTAAEEEKPTEETSEDKPEDKPVEPEAEPEATEPVAESTTETPAETPAPADSPAPESGTSTPPTPSHARTASFARSAHYRRPSVNADVLRGNSKSPLSHGDAQDIYHRQAETISTLTTDNEKLSAEIKTLSLTAARLPELQQERDALQESLAEIREELRLVKGRVEAAETEKKEADEEREKVKVELEAMEREKSHLATQLGARDKTIAELRLAQTGGADQEELMRKEELIGDMEMELNKLRHELERTQTEKKEAEEKGKEREKENGELKQKLAEVEAELEKVRKEKEAAGPVEKELEDTKEQLEDVKLDLEKAMEQISGLKKERDAAQTAQKEAETKASEAARIASEKSTKAQDLEDQLTEERKKTAALEGRMQGGSTDDDGVDELEDAERRRLRDRIKSLEDQLAKSTIVPQTGRARGMSLISEGSLLSDDVDYGELMKREMKVQQDKEAERKRIEAERLERIREVKRGLENWKGWRMDLTLLGGSPNGLGEMFEV